MPVFGNNAILQESRWTAFKAIAITIKGLQVQYEELTDYYDIFALDGCLVYRTQIFKGSVPTNSDYGQVQNDLDKDDFVGNYLYKTNQPFSGNTQVSNVVFSDGVITSSGSTIIPNLTSSALTLLINIKDAPTGTSPSITFSVQDVDPVDQVTVLGSPTVGTAITTAATQNLAASIESSAIRVSWTVTGTTPSFTGVNVSIAQKSSVTNVTVSSSSSVSSNQGTPNTLSNAWPITLTDGTNSAAIKAASTAAIATDPALVVAISPNNPISVSYSDTVTSGTIAANGVSITTSPFSGQCSVAIQITGTWVGTLQFEASVDGTNFVSYTVRAPNSGTLIVSTAANGTWRTSIAGFQLVRVRSSAWTSGTATVTIRQSLGTTTTVLTEALPTGANVIGGVTGSGNFITVGPGAVGAAVSGNPVRIGLSDGTNTRNTLGDTSGRTIIVGASAAASAVAGNPVLVGGSDGTNARYSLLDTTGRWITVGAGVAGTPAGGVFTIQGVSGGVAIPVDGSAVTQPISGTVTVTQGTAALPSAPWSIRLSDGASFYNTLNDTQLPSSLVGGRLDSNIGSWLGSTNPTVGQKTAVNSIPIVIASDQTDVPITATALPLPTGAATETSLAKLTLAQGSTTSGQSGSLNMGAVTTAAPTYTTGQTSPLSLDTSGSLRVSVTSGITSNPSVSTTGAAPPASATYIGGSVTTAAPTYTNGQMNALSLTTGGLLRVDNSGVTQPISGTVTANAGTGNFTVTQATASSLNATIVGAGTAGTPTGGVVSIQGISGGTAIPVSGTITTINASVSTTGSAPPASATYIGGSVTTAVPSYTTGQMSALSLTTAGLLRTDGSGTTQPVSGTITANAGTGSFTVAQATAGNLNATVVGSGNFTVVQGTAANLRSQTASESATGSATPATAGLSGGAVTTAAPTYTTGNLGALSLTTSGSLRVDGSAVTQPVSGTVTANQGGTWNITNISGTVSLPTGAATETTLGTRLADATFTGRINTLGQKTSVNSTPVVLASDQSTLAVSGTVTANAGTGSFTVAQATAANLRSQTAAEATTATATGTIASLVGGAVTTAAPTYTTGQMNPLSLTVSGALRVDGSSTTQPVSGTVTANQGGTWTVQPGNTANTTPWLSTVSQGGNSATVKAASTAAVAADPALVVSLSPNSGARLQDGAGNPLASYDLDNTGGTSYNLGVSLRTLTNGTPVELGTSANPIRVDPTGSTTQPVSGTVISNQGTANTATNGWFTKVTDGTNNAVVKPSSTAAAVGDGALVVSLSPNSPTPNASDRTVTGTITALNGTIQINTQGCSTLGWDTTGTWVATLVMEGSYDGGVTWYILPTLDTSTSLANTPIVVTSFGNGLNNHPWLTNVAGYSLVRLRASAFTSGTVTARFDASVGLGALQVYNTNPATLQVQSTIARTDPIVTGTLGALNSTVVISAASNYTIGGTITGTWVGTITAQGTIDGTNWFTVRTANKSTNDIIQTYTANDSFEFYSVAGCTQLRLQMTAYTSGTATVTLAGTSMATDAFLNYSGPDGDVAPPLRHVSISSLSNDGSLHSPRNTNIDPTGSEYAWVTRSLEYALATNGYQPAPNIISDVPVQTTTDASGRLEIHGSVSTDETSFRTDFTGSTLEKTLTGTVSFTNGSNVIVGVGTSFSTEVKSGDYIKKSADANTLYVQVDTIVSDTDIILGGNYTGTTATGVAGVVSEFQPSIGTGGAISVTGSNVILGSGTTANSSTYIVRKGDYGPVTVRLLCSLSQRIANNTFRIGLQDTNTLTPNFCAVIEFTGTSNTTVNCVTSSSSAASDTQTTTVTLPASLVSSPPTLEFKIDVSGTQVSFGVTNPATRVYYPLTQHNTHIPGPYDVMNIVLLSVNGAGAPATNTNLVTDMVYFQNVDRLQVDDDFSLEPLRVQVISGKPNNPYTYSAAIAPFTPAASPTDIFTITGSSTKTIRITRIGFTMNQTTASTRDVLLIKRSSANTGGTSTTVTNVSLDSQNPAGTAVVRAYTANPTGLGTLVGTVRARKNFIATLTGNNSNSDEFIVEFGTRPDTQNIVLRGTGEVLAINLNGVTSAGNSAACSIEWVEE